MALITTKEPFKGYSNWTVYKKQLDCFFLVNGIEENKKTLLLLITKLSPEVYKILQTLCLPNTLAQKSYKELTELLAEHYQPKHGKFIKKFKFRQRKQQQNETVQQFITALRKLTNQCKFSDTEKTILKQVMLGQKDENMQMKFLKREIILSMSKMIRTASATETAEALAERSNAETMKENTESNMFAFQSRQPNRRQGQRYASGQQQT